MEYYHATFKFSFINPQIKQQYTSLAHIFGLQDYSSPSFTNQVAHKLDFFSMEIHSLLSLAIACKLQHMPFTI